jgi:LmbE family N-acetylglucosaminyl deacetylase
MRFTRPTAEIFVPDGLDAAAALARTTHLCVGAHQDDIEIMAYHGVAQCFGRKDRWMTGVVVTNGAGSARSGVYADFTDEDMRRVRRAEQRKAAFVGEYAAQIQLDFTSVEVKKSSERSVCDDLFVILNAARPRTVYLHNPADKHDTHVAVLLRSIEALRRLPPDAAPEKVYGCEVWRDLDWLDDEEKVALPVSDHPNIAASLVGIFDSQITGGKRYDLATAGRRLANATYFASHATDTESAVTYALDLTPLVTQRELTLAEYTLRHLERFRDDVRDRIARLG